MDVPATRAAAACAPKQGSSALHLTWPRSAQVTLVFILGALTTLIAVHAYGYLRWGTRPLELERGLGITYRIDLNQATRAELLQLPGIGESLAQRIEAYRFERGNFHHVNDLLEVRGIGPATLERLRPWVQVKLDNRGLSSEDQRVQPPTNRVKRDLPNHDSGSGRKPSQKEANLTSAININRATITELQRLPGIGPRMSQRIVDEREKSPFKSVEDLRRVAGIGPKTLERLKPYVTVNSESLRLVSADRDSDPDERR